MKQYFKHKIIMAIIVTGIISILFFSCWQPKEFYSLLSEQTQKAEDYNVMIYRDTWGVPHIFGQSDEDAAFGLAYANAEDDFKNIQDLIITLKQKSGLIHGKSGAITDFLINWLRIYKTVDQYYESQLSEKVRRILEAYATGINYYAHIHNDEILADVFPVQGKDIVAGFVFRTPMFFGLDSILESLFNLTEKPKLSSHLPANNTSRHIGSNGFAVSPKRTANKETFLAINSHQPWDGPIAWYEAHIHSEEGWNMSGGLFPGSPIIFVGHNDSLGWVHTVNAPDLIDTYILEMHPDNSLLYRFDDQWLELEKEIVSIKIKIFGLFNWTIKREALWSVHGPVLQFEHGTYAIRYAGLGDIRQVEQWYRMNKAQNFKDWKSAMHMRSIPSFNSVFADYTGNIFYLYNGNIPVRKSGFDWKNYLPGWTSETLWDEIIPFSKLPMVQNPASGLLYSTNQSPLYVSEDSDNLKLESLPKHGGIELTQNNRSLRLSELFSPKTNLTFKEFEEIKYDMYYSKQSVVAKYVEAIIHAIDEEDSVLQTSKAILKKWNLSTHPENTEAALGMLTLTPFLKWTYQKIDEPLLIEYVRTASKQLMDIYKTLTPPYGKVHRLIRGKQDLEIGGGPDILHAVYATNYAPGKMRGFSGDGLVYLVKWDSTGKVYSQSIHQYGSATSRPDSPHYSDQSALFARREMKPVWRTKTEILQNLESSYKPGEEIKN